MGGKSSQTVGYWYLMGLHMGAGRGPVDELIEIRVGGLTAWKGCVSSFGVEDTGSEIEIEAEDLFGGEEKEGGVAGPLQILWGGDGQVAPANMVSDLGGDVPGFRGVTTFYFDGKICANNPYPKEWEFRLRRARQGWFDEVCWYETKARIGITVEEELIVAMNAAHILVEIATNPEWGRGLPFNFLDLNSYVYAANQLCDEGLGLCIPWFRQEDIATFTQVVIDHIGGTQYVSRETGKLTLRLIRADYDVDDLPLFTPDTGLLDIQDDDQSASDTGFNEIIVMGHDPVSNTDFGVRAHNLAAIQSVGSIISNTIEYKGLPTRDLALRKAVSELKLQTGIRKPRVILDRRGWKLAPGMPFRISWPERGIASMVLRVGQVADGTHENGQIVVDALTDVFNLPDTTYADVQPPSWVPPNLTAAPPAATKLIEVPYRTLYQLLDPSNLALLSVDSTTVAELAAKPLGTATTGYDLVTKTSVEADYVKRNTGSFTGYSTIAVDIGILDTSIALTSVVGFPDDPTEFIGDAGMLGTEFVRIDAYNAGTGIMTIARGVMDTVPAEHLSGTVFWLADDDMTLDTREYAPSEIISAKALTRTSTDLLDEAAAATDTVTLEGRQGRPYPPAKVTVDGVEALTLPGDEHNEPVIDWAHRNRITEQDQLVAYGAASIAAEAGTTYNIRVFDNAAPAVVIRTVAGAAKPWTYDLAMQGADGGPIAVWIELESERDGLTSYQFHRFLVVLSSGYGYGYGLNYGGA